MVWKLECDCNERFEIKIKSIKLFKELKDFFDIQVEKGIFKEEEVTIPFYLWKGNGAEKKWYATKWYKCLHCGCLWEFNYPDFPANGFVRKLEDGAYYAKE
jgi:hypothetical protein